MRANNRKDMRLDKSLSQTMRVIPEIRNMNRKFVFLSSFLALALLIACSTGCAPGNQSSSDSVSSDLPELTEDIIRERINNAFIREVPEVNGIAEPISWNFDESEPKEIAVIEKQLKGARATLVLDIKTRSASYVRNPRYLEGRIRTEWELKTGWAMRKWEIVESENISMKYKNLPKPPAQNSNR